MRSYYNLIKMFDSQDVAKEICRRLVSLFEADPVTGKRPCHGDNDSYAKDEFWKELVLFYEFFQADTGRGCGARLEFYRNTCQPGGAVIARMQTVQSWVRIPLRPISNALSCCLMMSTNQKWLLSIYKLDKCSYATLSNLKLANFINFDLRWSIFRIIYLKLLIFQSSNRLDFFDC